MMYYDMIYCIIITIYVCMYIYIYTHSAFNYQVASASLPMSPPDLKMMPQTNMASNNSDVFK